MTGSFLFREWGDEIRILATNHVDKRRWQHTGNGRDEEQPVEKRVGWKRHPVGQGQWCRECGAWCGELGLEPTPSLYVLHLVQVFREVRRVVRKDGTLWLVLGDSYATGAGKVGKHPGGGHHGDATAKERSEESSHEHYLSVQIRWIENWRTSYSWRGQMTRRSFQGRRFNPFYLSTRKLPRMRGSSPLVPRSSMLRISGASVLAANETTRPLRGPFAAGISTSFQKTV